MMCGEYSNSIYVRRNKSGSFTLWILASGVAQTVKDCWQRNLKTPEDFVRGFTECVGAALMGSGRELLEGHGHPSWCRLKASDSQPDPLSDLARRRPRASGSDGSLPEVPRRLPRLHPALT